MSCCRNYRQLGITFTVFVIKVPKTRSHIDPEEKGNSSLRNALYCRMRTVRYAEHYGEHLSFPEHVSLYL